MSISFHPLRSTLFIFALSVAGAVQATDTILVDEGNGALREMEASKIDNERVKLWRVNTHLGSKEIFADNQWGVIVAPNLDLLMKKRMLRQRIYQNALPWISGEAKSQGYTLQTAKIAMMVGMRPSSAFALIEQLETDAMALIPLHDSVVMRFDAPTLKKHSSKPVARQFALYVKDILSIFQAIDELHARGADGWGEIIVGEEVYQRAVKSLERARETQPLLQAAFDKTPSLEAPRVARAPEKESVARSSKPKSTSTGPAPRLIDLGEALRNSPTTGLPDPYKKAAPGEEPYGEALKPGFAISPFAPKDAQGKTQLVDVSGIPAGQTVKCPYTGGVFRVPPGAATVGAPPATTVAPK